MLLMSLARVKARRQNSGIIYFTVFSLSVGCNGLNDYPCGVQDVKYLSLPC